MAAPTTPIDSDQGVAEAAHQIDETRAELCAEDVADVRLAVELVTP